MIKFTSLVTAIQGAIDQAVDMVARENINALMDYFQPDTKQQNRTEALDGMSTNQALSAIMEMEPKTVRLKYPNLTPNGSAERYISVPLITLSPIPNLALNNVEIEMDLEVVEANGDVMVGLPKIKSDKSGLLKNTRPSTPNPNAKIKITIKADERAEGVTTLIEGYNKVVRAQLPE